MRWLCLAGAVAFIAIQAHAADTGFLLPRDTPSYLRHDYLTGSAYLHLRPDGSYRRINRQHLFVEENDRGTWEQKANGELHLHSALHLHNITYNHPRLTIFQWHQQEAADLANLASEIEAFLHARKDPSFTQDEVGRIRRHRDKPGTNEKDVRAGIAVISPGPVAREELEGLVRSIHEFLHSETKNVFVLTPVVYRSSVVFIWKEGERLTNRVIADELKQAPYPGERGDRHGFLAISEKNFLEDVKELQPFIFYPGMNEIMKNRPR